MIDNLIKVDNEGIRINVHCKLSEISNDLNKTPFSTLKEVIDSLPSPLKENGTLEDELCQSPACEFYHKPPLGNPCLRKGGKSCYAFLGNHEDYSIFGASNGIPAPCEKACPAGIEISSYLELLLNGDKEGAAKKLFAVNPFSAITGRICTTPCQVSCNRTSYDETVQIRNIERYLGDYILENYTLLLDEPAEMTGKRIAVMGSGPDSLAAAFYLKEYGHAVTVYEKEDKLGGILNGSFSEFRLQSKVLSKVIDMLETIGVEFKMGEEGHKNSNLEDYSANHHGLFIGCEAVIPNDSSLLTEDGKLVVDEETYATNIGGIYAAGDVLKKSEPIAFAISAGHKAAEVMNQYLNRAKRLEDAEAATEEKQDVNNSMFDATCLENSKSVIMPSIPKKDRGSDSEDTLGYDELDAKKEVKRCFHCGCVAVNPSEIATVLVALDAKFITSKRVLMAEDFFTGAQINTTVLEEDEEFLEVLIPKPYELSKLVYKKGKNVNLAISAYINKGIVFRMKIALGGVSPTPYRPKKAEFMMFKKSVGEESADVICEAVLHNALPLLGNGYKVKLVGELIKDAILK